MKEQRYEFAISMFLVTKSIDITGQKHSYCMVKAML